MALVLQLPSTVTSLAPARNPFDLAFASFPEPMLLVDEDGGLAGVNLATEVLLGERVAAAALRADRVEGALPWLGAAVREVLAGAPEARLEAQLVTPGGRRSISARVRPMRDAAGGLRGAVVVLDDQTERRAEESRSRAAERVAAVGSLAAGLAHEVNSPLACVVAGLAFVESEHARLAGALAPAELLEAAHALEDARDAAVRVGRIMQALQRFGQPASPLVRAVDLEAALREAVRLALPELGALSVQIEPVLPARVAGSEPLLAELFQALLVHVARGGGAGALVRVAARGIPDEARVSVTVSRGPAHGEGLERAPARSAPLCLTVARGIASALGGTLKAGACTAGGASVEVILPLDEGAEG